MQRFLILLFATSILSCTSNSNQEITLPNQDIKIDNNLISYKDKPFTGILKLKNQEQGTLNLKDGHLTSTNELRNDHKKQIIKFTILNDKFDGEAIFRDPEFLVNMVYVYKNGIITHMNSDMENQIKYNLTFNNGLGSGIIEMQGQAITFKDGISELSTPNGEEIKMKLSIDSITGDMTLENSVDGLFIGKQSMSNKMTRENIEKIIFTKIQSLNNF